MPPLRYLTVQDIVWIALLVTGSPQKFRYLDLEEATHLQYGYGHSTDLLGQAARFLAGFMKKKPLAEGNEATAFLAFAAFLRINGKTLAIPNEKAAAWARSLPESDDLRGEVAKAAQDAEGHDEATVQQAVEEAMRRFARALADLGCRSALCCTA